MPDLIPFTSNVVDCSTNDGYQFEFHCQRCGNGFRSRFRHSVTGFGGRLAALGGSILGGEFGNRVEEVGMMAQWNRSGVRGSTNDKRLMEAADDVAAEFRQCRWCTEWVCRQGCWDGRTDCCRNCASATRSVPEQQQQQQFASYGQAPAGAARYCGHCGAEGSGKFCGSCGTAYDAPPCRGCGSPLRGTAFCQNCGTRVG